jgi:hypothetical protein
LGLLPSEEEKRTGPGLQLANNILVNEMNFYLNPPSVATVRRRSHVAYFAFDNSLPPLLYWVNFHNNNSRIHNYGQDIKRNLNN